MSNIHKLAQELAKKADISFEDAKIALIESGLVETYQDGNQMYNQSKNYNPKNYPKNSC